MSSHAPGGGFLLGMPAWDEVFVPERFGREERMIAETAASFVAGQVLPVLEELEAGKHEHSVRLMHQAGELGLLGADVPEAFGGLGLNKMTSTWITEVMAGGYSFAITFGAHTGIGTLPIAIFGTPEQKRRYLPALASGEKVAAYALTEPGAGSDALGGKASAVLSADGTHYLLNGEKQWITNAAFADVFIVYAKVPDAGLTAFIVDRDAPGVSVSGEFHKMGIKGSSTCSLILQDARVPVENVLGQVGRGHIIAFNTLNIGRWKLAAGCVGSCKQLIDISARYAQERRQFGRPIASFPLIQQKLAEMAARTYALEAMVYRTAELWQRRLAGLDLTGDTGQAAGKAIGEYAVEASINKVFGSEVLDFVVDEAVQIHGGYGYMQEYAVERAYRDSRINRIFEGTNEINRLLIPGTLLRRALKGELPLLEALGQVQAELSDFGAAAPPPPSDEASLELELQLLEGARKLTLAVAGLGAQKFMDRAEQEQEFLAAVADLCIELYAGQSAALRATAVAALRPGMAEAAAGMAMARSFIHGALDRMEMTARRALAGMESGDTLRTQLAVVRRLTRRDPVDLVALGRRVAAAVLEAGGYPAAPDLRVSVAGRATAA